MELSDALASQLAELRGSAIRLPDAIEQLHGLLLHVVPSAIGLALTIRISEVDLTVTTSPDGVVPQSSLRVPLSMWAGFEAGSEVVFYASKAGSLVDLAAELGWTLGLSIVWSGSSADPVLMVDQHLTPVSGFSGLDDLSAVNRAIGVLLSRGRSRSIAVDDLRRAATKANSSTAAAARALLGELRRSADGRHIDLSLLTARARWDGTAGPGDHLCGLYRGESQRDEIMLPYLKAGLIRGDQCLCLIDRTDPAAIRDRLSGITQVIDEPRLDIQTASDVYLSTGDFVAAGMYDFLDETALAVVARDGGTHFRATGEMSWATGDSRNLTELFSYESSLNRMTSAHAPALLCLFDLDDLDDLALENVLMTHPTIVFEHNVIDNPHYRNPDSILAGC